jgi:ABC-2 type transport system ATP-binding protein
MNALDVIGISKSHSAFQLENINFALLLGKVMGLIGKNGAGKTTLLQIISGGLVADRGEVLILGETNKDVRVRQNVGVVFEAIPFPSVWTPIMIEKNLSTFYLNWNSKKYYELLEHFNLDKKKRIKEMSKGMKLKTMIAFACSYDAKLLILDEPTSGLDPVSRCELLNYFKEYVCDGKHSILFSTHITSDLEKIATQIGFLVNGNLRCLIGQQIASNCCIVSTELTDFKQFEKIAIQYSISNHIVHFLAKCEDLPYSLVDSSSPATLDNIMLLLDGSYWYD